MLPTPEAKLGSAGPDHARAGRERSGGDDLTTAVDKLLPTPRAGDGDKGGPNQHGSSGDLMLPSAAVRLLPTPTTQDGANNAGPSQHDRNTPPLNTAVTLLPTVRLLPTPAVNDMGEGKTVEDWDDWTDDMKAKHGNGNGHGASLAIEAQRLLPTPSASDAAGGKTSRSGDRKDEPLLGGIDRLLPTPVTDPDAGNGHARDLGKEARLLPTPRVGADRTSRSAATRQDSMSAPSLGQAVEIAAGVLPHEFESFEELPPSWQPGRLLPTPTAMDSEASGGAHPKDVTLTDATVRNTDRWGDYAPAIYRWVHIIARDAPDPTQPSSKGNPQLAPKFVEWMMGLPAGHVTDVPDMTRNEMLKALGNGVVPQQALAGLVYLIHVWCRHYRSAA